MSPAANLCRDAQRIATVVKKERHLYDDEDKEKHETKSNDLVTHVCHPPDFLVRRSANRHKLWKEGGSTPAASTNL